MSGWFDITNDADALPPACEQPIRLIAVEDDPADLDVLASVAQANGFQLRASASGSGLADEIVSHQPDAVLLDVMLPGSSGYDLCRTLKANPATRAVPVVIITSLDGPEARRRAHQVGCDEFIQKPINRHELAFRLRSFARLRRDWAERPGSVERVATLERFAVARERALSGAGRRLLRLADGFAAHLALAKSDARLLRLAASLHDLTDAPLPAPLVVKSAPLLLAERELVDRHLELGAALIEPGVAPHSDLLLATLRHHHERWRGGGHPDGLSGIAIPPLARVLRVLDVMDALAGGRPEQPPHSPAAALVVLKRERDEGGIDPELSLRFEDWLGSAGRPLLTG